MPSSTDVQEYTGNLIPAHKARSNRFFTNPPNHVRKEEDMIMTICQMHNCTYRIPPPTLELTLLSLLRRWLHV